MRARRFCCLTVLCAALLGTLNVAFAASQTGRGKPENDTAALAALVAHNPSGATSDLKAAVASTSEPPAARTYAKQALALIGARKGIQAGLPAGKGAAVENLTYALADLQAHDPLGASKYLMKAADIGPSKKPATAALGAIKHHKIAPAVQAITAALSTLQP
jgi:hypothetical protein